MQGEKSKEKKLGRDSQWKSKEDEDKGKGGYSSKMFLRKSRRLNNDKKTNHYFYSVNIW